MGFENVVNFYEAEPEEAHRERGEDGKEPGAAWYRAHHVDLAGRTGAAALG